MKSADKKPKRRATRLIDRLVKGPRRPASQRVAFGWYGAEQWGRLRELAADAAAIDLRYEEWLRSAEATLADLESRGIAVVKVPIDVEAAVRWSAAKGLPFNSAARAAFVAEVARGTGGEPVER